MTVFELRAALAEIAPDTLVVVAGNEGGFYDVASVVEKKIKLNANRSGGWQGPHDDDECYKPDVAAVCIT